jgi:hypothetical protein
MKLLAAEVWVNSICLAIALVPDEFVNPASGNPIIRKLQPHFPGRPIMLVSVVANGFRAHASFQTGELLALLQLESIGFKEVDTSMRVAAPQPMPF